MASKRVIGVDVGGTKILAGLIDAGGTVERTVEVPTPHESQAVFTDALVSVAEELRTQEVDAVCYAVPTRVDRKTGYALGAVNIPVQGLALRDEIGGRLGLPVRAINDASAAALAELRLGAGRGTNDLVMLTLGTGVGGGVVTEGRLDDGWTEFGHMVIVVDGEPCPGTCTGLGHVESYCSGQAADRIARRELGAGATAHDLVAQDHPALDEIGHYLGAAIASLLNVYDPEIVVIGGGFGVAAGERLFPPARATILRDALDPAGANVRLALAELGAAAGMIGAGLVAHEAA